MFLNTLGYSSDKIVTSLKVASEIGSTPLDRRGTRIPKHAALTNNEKKPKILY